MFVKNLFHEKYIVFFYKKYINVCNCRFEIVANMSRTCYKEIHKCLEFSPNKKQMGSTLMNYL